MKKPYLLKKPIQFDHKSVLITGAAGHVGQQMAEAFAELGATLFLVDKPKAGLNEVAESLLKGVGADVCVVEIDFEAENCADQIEQIVSRKTDRVDVLVNNAAFVGTSELTGWACGFEHQDLSVFDRALHVNVTVPFSIVQKLHKHLLKSGEASVINIASIYGIVAPDMDLYKELSFMNPAAYAASKAALLQLTRWLASALAPTIRVNAISPGGIWRNQPTEFCERYNKKTLLNRMATETDLIGALLYLASHLSAYVTGQNIIVDGGWTTT